MAGNATRNSILEFGDGVSGAAVAPTTITLANGRASFSATAHGLAENEIIGIDPVVGFTGMPAFGLVTVDDANTFSIPAPNAVGTFASGGNATPRNGAFTPISSAFSFNFSSEDDRLDVSAIDTTEGFREFVNGMSDGNFSLELNWRPSIAAHGLATGIQALKAQQADVWIRFSFPQAAIGGINSSAAILARPLSAEFSGSTEEKLSMTLGGALNSGILSRV